VPRPRKVSQTQLARELGISQALVSLVLNGRKAGISAETYERVWSHAVKRGYHPKGMHLASSPAATHAHQVGFILRAGLQLHAPTVYFGRVQHGLHTALEGAGFSSVFLGYEDELDAKKLRRFFKAGHHFKGVVLLGEVARPFLEELRRVERRIVAVSARYPGLCHSVLGNEPQALETLVAHLHGLGHRRFGWLGGNAGLGRHEARLAALRAALDHAGLALDPRYGAKLAQADRAEGFDAMEQLLAFRRRKDFPTAFICFNSTMAAGALKALLRAGVPVPAEVSVAAADISRAATDHVPPIAAAGSSPEKLGEAAARLVLTSTGAEDEVFTDLMLPAQFFPGATTARAN
jgi:LacI family transcriptional regulator